MLLHRLKIVGGLLLVLSLAARPLAAESLGGGAVAIFASAAEGQKILTERDNFVRRLSPFDRSARLKTERPVNTPEYLALVGRSVRDWEAEERGRASAALQSIRSALETLALPFPKTVWLVRTTGQEEGGATYTRGPAIVLPPKTLASSKEALGATLAHELFHVLSRHHPDLRDRLYADLGFRRVRELKFPKALAARKLTNPDAPRNEHAIQLSKDGENSWAIPILFATRETYDIQRGGEFFEYLDFKLLLVELQGDTRWPRPVYDEAKLRLLAPSEVSGFFEQVGRNTGYIIHPEEILAEHFSHLVRQTPGLASPHLVERMEQTLAAWKAER